MYLESRAHTICRTRLLLGALRVSDMILPTPGASTTSNSLHQPRHHNPNIVPMASRLVRVWPIECVVPETRARGCVRSNFPVPEDGATSQFFPEAINHEHIRHTLLGGVNIDGWLLVKNAGCRGVPGRVMAENPSKGAQ